MTSQPPPGTGAAPGAPGTEISGLDEDALAAACAEGGDRRAAWRFATAFARDWSTRPLAADDGVTDEELRAAETRLGLPLPAALREAHLLLGRRPDLTSRHDALLTPDELYLDEDRGVLVHRVENQGCAYWGIRTTDLHLPDPAVLVRPDVAAPIAEHWEPWLEHVSVEITWILLAEAVMGEGPCTDAIWEPGEDDYAALETRFRPLPLPTAPPAPDPGSRWFAGENALLCDDGAMIHVRGRSPEALAAARAAFPGAAWLEG